jgi:leader peptidase (prepilin peptidase)/N-methyltransferase
VSEAVLWAGALAVLGAILGSFAAALVVRWPAGRSVVHGRSACDACGRTLRAGELVPLLSALRLRGRCRGCGARIDPVHAQIEGLALAIGALSGWIAPGAQGLAGAAFGWLLLALAWLDWRAFWLPDRLTGALALGGVASGLAGVVPALVDRAIGGVAGVAALWAIGEGYRRWRGRVGLGGGDPKLLGAIGLWLGWRMLPAVLLTASLVGLGVVAVRAVAGRRMARDEALPLGTLLAVAAYPAWAIMIMTTP